MSGLDIAALLEETAGTGNNTNNASGSRSEHDQDVHRDGTGRDDAKDSRRRRNDNEHEKGDPHRDRHHHRDSYRGGGSRRSRSRSPAGSRHYRPSGRGDRNDRRGGRDDERDYDRSGERERDHRQRDRERDLKAGPSDRERTRDRDSRMHDAGRRRSRSPKKEPQLTEDERDRRTIFVQQLAARLRSKDLVRFFDQAGPVQEAQIVKDRVSSRSKGLASFYAECLFTEANYPTVLVMSNSRTKSLWQRPSSSLDTCF